MADVWINGRLVAEDAACVAADDRGFTVGDGVFEAIVLTPVGPFAVSRHLRRLRAAAARVGIPLVDDDELRAAIDAVSASNDLGGTAVIRVTVSAGRGGGTLRTGLDPTLVVALRAIAPQPDLAAVAVSPWPRNERGALAGVKTTSYGENILALEHARERGAGEVVWANTSDELCEGSGSNVFLEVEGRLVTPPLASGCLPGVTRALLLEAGVGVEETVPMSAFAATTEAFLTSTTREVQAIVSVDGRALPAAPGPLTAAATDAWRAAYGPGTSLDP